MDTEPSRGTSCARGPGARWLVLGCGRRQPPGRGAPVPGVPRASGPSPSRAEFRALGPWSSGCPPGAGLGRAVGGWPVPWSSDTWSGPMASGRVWELPPARGVLPLWPPAVAAPSWCVRLACAPVSSHPVVSGTCRPPGDAAPPRGRPGAEPVQQRQGRASQGGRDLGLLPVQPAHRPRGQCHAGRRQGQVRRSAQPRPCPLPAPRHLPAPAPGV